MAGSCRRVLSRLAALVSIGLLVGSLMPARTASAAPPFVTAVQTHLEIAGTPWFLFGASTYGTSNPGAPTSIDAEIDLAKAAGLNALRIVNMFDERGVDATAPVAEASWERVDQLLAAMATAGLRAILDLSAFRNHLQNRELYLRGMQVPDNYPLPPECTGRSGDDLARCIGTRWCVENPTSCTDPYSTARATEWSDFLGFVATRVNTVTGIEYRADPTIALVAFAGEPNPPNSGEPLKPTTQELTDFYARVFDQWKSYDTNHLVTTGGLLHVDWEELYGGSSGIDYQAIWSLPNQDVLSVHNYFARFPAVAANDTKTGKIATAAAAAGKPWITEEFGEVQQPVDDTTTYTEADRGSWFTDLFLTDLNPARLGASGVVPAAGLAFWNLGPEVASASYDVNPNTPATWAAVLNFSSSLAAGVSVTDAGYAPKSFQAWLGALVRWTFSGLANHSVTDAARLGPAKGALFNSGLQNSGTFEFRFLSAGTYPYRSTLKADRSSAFTGQVAVPLRAPIGGRVDQAFTVTWSSGTPTGYSSDVRLRIRPVGKKWGAWVTWQAATTSASAAYTATQPGTYEFQARLRNTSTAITSLWSPGVLVTVSR